MSTTLERARWYAAYAHRHQKYGDKPYTEHLQYVESVLERFGVHDIRFRAAAWLHDSVEDTATLPSFIEDEFGKFVGGLVWAVTGQGKNRKERNKDMFNKIKRFPDAVTLKLADRIANVENCVIDKNELLTMYRKELPEFIERFRQFALNEVENKMLDHLQNLIK